METGDVIRVKSLSVVSRPRPGLTATIGYKPPKGKEFVLVLIGAATPEENSKELAQKMLNALGWELQREQSGDANGG